MAPSPFNAHDGKRDGSYTHVLGTQTPITTPVSMGSSKVKGGDDDVVTHHGDIKFEFDPKKMAAADSVKASANWPSDREEVKKEEDLWVDPYRGQSSSTPNSDRAGDSDDLGNMTEDSARGVTPGIIGLNAEMNVMQANPNTRM